MKKSGILAAAAVLAAAVAGPAIAQDVSYNRGYCAQFYPNGNCYAGSYQRQVDHDQAYRDRAWQNSYNRWDNDSGISPGDVAAGVVVGAVGTATPPFVSEDYARRNGFVCMPGSLFRGEDGLMHICQ